MRVDMELQAGSMAFAGEVEGHRLVVDAAEVHGGQGLGPNPKQYLLTGLSTCTAMDIISILRKMKQEPESLVVSAEGELRDAHPKIFEHLDVTVTATGELNPKKLWKAVRLSRDNYCGVAAMLRPTVALDYHVVLNGEEVPEP